MRKTKIVATIGPTSEQETVLNRLLKYVNVCRLNFSHGNYGEHRLHIDTIRKINKDTAILLDTKGPEVRTGEFVSKIILKADQEITLKNEDVIGTEKQFSITYKGLYKQVDKGQQILLNDGKVLLEVQCVKETDIICKVRNSGKVDSRKNVHIPNVHLNIDFLSQKDRDDIQFAIEHDVDFIALSFVQCKQNVILVRKILDENHSTARIISKIESNEAIKNFDEILDVSDGIMVARGDLGVEVDIAKVPLIQKSLIQKASQHGKFTIVATQMLDSMIDNPIPTRAEVSDVVNAVFDKTDAVMLSGETAKGKYPVEAVKVMHNALVNAEEFIKPHISEPRDFTDFIAKAACNASYELDVKAIISPSRSGLTVDRVSSYRPRVPVIALLPTEKLMRQSQIRFGVIPFHKESGISDILAMGIRHLIKLKILSRSDKVIITGGIKQRMTDTLIVNKVSNLIS